MKILKAVTIFQLSMMGAGVACGDSSSGTGTVQVFVEPEDTIPLGLEPGTDEENIKDGWTVVYERFLITVGNFRARSSAAPDSPLDEPRVYVVDLKNVSAGGLVIAEFPNAAAVRYDRVGYDLRNATSAALKGTGTSEADHQFMIQNGYSVYFEGTITKPDGQSCRPTAPADCAPATRVAFNYGLSAGTAFDDCAPTEGDAGFAVPTGGTVQVKPTIHGDHWFFSNITQGAEITDRLAQWIANSDLDRNGEATIAELKNVRASDVFPSSAYNLSGALIPINTAYDYLEAQARTLGDFQGEGECPTRAKLALTVAQ